MDEPLTNKQLIDKKEREWLNEYAGWDLIQEYWVDEGCHILIGKAGSTYYMFRTFCYDNMHAMLSCDFTGNKTEFVQRLLYLLHINSVKTSIR